MRATTKSKQSEAKQILKQVYVMQRAYRQEHDTYTANGATATAGGSFATLGVDIMSTARYSYAITADSTTFSATATANLDDDGAIDTWSINQTGTLSCSINDAET